ncbi:heat shock 70 kDa protein 13 isoform 2-T2 [Leptodactylus fuscus]|uniref:heat shock 70 kDa protein 13 isoform X2 n=1 Tax=Leptodactylus fuscus TaxID=238119 RepID=UPI003F4E9A14
MSGEMTILGSAILTLLLAGYLAQQYLPMPTPKVIGIDLGTTYCSVGVFHPGTGDVKVIADQSGHQSIPSTVSFTKDDVYAGYEGLELADANPQNTIYDAKRFIGKIFTPEELERESERYPFKVLYKDGEAVYSIKTNETITVSPEYIGSQLLLKLKKMAEEYLGIPVSKAVISVPAEFDERQRNYTVRAANLAGNNKLGGQDFNQRLLQYLYNSIYSTYGSLPPLKEEIHRLRQSVEAVKLNLTLYDSSWVRMPLTLPRRQPSKAEEQSQTAHPKEEATRHREEDHPKMEKIHFQAEISRKLFEHLNKDLFEKILVPIEQVLKEGHLAKDEVDEIVLVGGSTRIPRIRQVIRDYFNKEPNTSVDPDLAVVTGVAIQAGIVGGSWPLQVSAIEIPNRHLRKTNFN